MQPAGIRSLVPPWYELQTSDVHIGIDGGQKMLKLGVTITERTDSEKSGRCHYSDVSEGSLRKMFSNFLK